jgi:cytochrome c
MKIKSIALAASTLVATAFAGAAAADGAAIYLAKGCIGCHGAEGKAPIMGTYPKLAGQNKEYAAAQIKAIRDGKRTSDIAVAMQATIAGMSDADVDAVAAYLSTVK